MTDTAGASPQPLHSGAAPADGRIVVENLTKTFGSTRAVDALSFTVEPGSVTGFLGPNGAGKTTTLRMLLGLVRPTGGTATIGGQRYHDIHNPLQVVGAALEAASFHPARTGRNHLRVYCAAAGIPDNRADEVLELVGLGPVGRKKVRGYSMGMRQRLGLAATLLGNPRVLILDEPANGLDPEGIRWLRGFFRHLAAEGRTILVSSHQLAEVQAVADRVVILNQGRLVRQGSIAELAENGDTVVVRSPSAPQLAEALRREGIAVELHDPTLVRVPGGNQARIGHTAFVNNIELHELSLERFDLEKLFFSLTQGAFAANDLTPGAQQPPTGYPPPPGYQPQPGYQPPPGNQPPPGFQPPPGHQPGYPPPGYQPPPPGNQPPSGPAGGDPWAV
ncbi:ABC-2 type transport system ATP-binding protein [Frankineae bacterium MT45]|nr:ABC-2 type transport system ATP-binding protein [Frankineae bacterium MT45]